MANLSPEIAFRYLLTTSAAVVALLPANNIQPSAASELLTVPFAVYSVISTQRERHLLKPSGLAFRRCQLDVVAATNAQCAAISNAIRNRLDGYVGQVTLGADSLKFQNVELLDERDNYVSPSDGSDVGLYRRLLDFRFSYPETIPDLT